MKVNNLSFVPWTIGLFCLFLLAGSTFGPVANAQDEDELPDPRTVSLETKDGVTLSATYYPGTNEKETVPVILLHAWEDDHETMIKIANTLQRQFGFAAIVPDLRGHGKSNRTTGGEKLDRDRWRAKELAAVIEDIEACKKFSDRGKQQWLCKHRHVDSRCRWRIHHFRGQLDDS